MISDIIVALFMPVIVLNIVIVLMVFIKNILENIFNTCQLSKLFKCFMLYVAVSLPVIIAYVCYRFFYVEKIEIVSNDVSEAYYINDKTIANSTDLGNNAIFIIMLVAWITGIIILGILRLFNEIVFLKRLEKLSKIVTDDKSIEIRNKLIKELGIKKDVRIFTNSIIPSPFIIGFIPPKIFIPENKFSELQLEFILRHELTHLAVNDYIYRKIIFFICIIYWFNPVTYILSDRFIEINEMACDEKVLRGYKKKEKAIYMKMLCEMACDEEDMNNIIYFKGKTEKSFERRLKNMMKTKKEVGKLSYVLASAFILGLCPVVSYAATDTAINTQSNIISILEKYRDTVEVNTFRFKEQQEMDYGNIMEIILQEALPVSGTINLDTKLNGKNRFVTRSTDLEKGSKIDFSLEADSSNKSFRAGLMDSNNKKIYVESNNGQIFYKFTIEKSGKYKLFIEGINAGEDVHVTGYAYINN